MSRRSGKVRSQRQLRVGELIRHALADIFLREDFDDRALAGQRVTVTAVDVSPDLRHAMVFVTPAGNDQQDALMAALGRRAGGLRRRIGHSLQLKFTPALRFAVDQSFDQAGHIEALLRGPRVARDLRDPDAGDMPAPGADNGAEPDDGA